MPAKNLFEFLGPSFRNNADRTALVTANSSLTYAELSERVGRVARNLSERSVKMGSTVALCLDRSPELIVSVLGVIRAGAAYVPIDPTYPTERIAGMLVDSNLHVVITDRAHQHLFKGTKAKLLLIDEIDLENGPLFEGECPAKPENLAYVLFTSGSTGRPKGVAMHHAPLLNLIQWQLRTSVLKEGDRTLQFAPISFDVSFQEISPKT